MALKNLFAYLNDESSNDIDEAVYENPYETKHAPADLVERMQFHDPEEAKEGTDTPKKHPLRNKYYLGALLSTLVMLAIFLVSRNVTVATAETVLMILCLPAIIMTYVFLFKAKRSVQKDTQTNPRDDADIDAQIQKIQQAQKEALAYMGVPEGTVTIDVLPYPYIMKKGKAVYTGKKNTFDNTPMDFYVQNNRLCITDGESLFEIPLSDVVGYRTYDTDYRIEFWLKEEKPDSEKFAPYDLKKAGFFEYKTHTYYGVEIQDGSTGQGYELLIAGYDFDSLKALIDLTPLQ